MTMMATSLAASFALSVAASAIPSMEPFVCLILVITAAGGAAFAASTASSGESNTRTSNPVSDRYSPYMSHSSVNADTRNTVGWGIVRNRGSYMLTSLLSRSVDLDG